MITPQHRQRLRDAGYSEAKINAFEAWKANKEQEELDAQKPKSLGDKFSSFSSGFVKGGLQSSIGTARLIQDLGQRTLAGIDPTRNVAQVKAETGLKSLQGAPAAEIDEQLKSRNPYETAGKVAEFGAELVFPVGKTTEVASALNKGKNLIKKGASATVDTTKGLSKRFLSGKTAEEVLATPRKQVSKLSSAERSYYFDNLKAGIEKEFSQAEKLADEGLKVDLQGIADESEALTRELQETARDKVVELRPKIVKALGRQSQKYRALVEKEISKVADTPIEEKSLIDFIDSRFVDDPNRAQAIRSRLGLEASEAGREGTVRSIFDKLTEVKKDLSGAAKKGTRVFSPDEKLTDDAITTLSQFLKQNGLDLSEANQFWAKYAPIRNQLITEAKPFLQSGTQTKTFANTLTRVARGKDVNNEKFIKEVEELIGEKITPKIKEVVSKMDANTKAEAVRKIEAEGKALEIKLAKERKLKKLTDEQFEANRKAGWRRIIKNIIIYGGTGTGVTTLGAQALQAATN